MSEDEDEEKIKNEMRRAFIDRHFVGEAFQDKIFNAENTNREIAASWKILQKPDFKFLTDNSWYWKAVGLPVHLLSNGPQGDIDLIFCVRVPERGADNKLNMRRLYRCFEVKTAKVTIDGRATSLKLNKFKKVTAQLNKLWELGIPQLFLLEVFIIQAGYSQIGDDVAYPTEVREPVIEKYLSLKSTPFGYVVSALEQMLGYDEDQTGLIWPHFKFKDAEEQPLRAPFADMVAAIEAHLEQQRGGYHATVTYCYGCHKLITVDDRGPFECTCGRPLF